MDADRKQLQLREREAKIHEWEGKMNAAKNNREFQAIKEQIAADSQANSVLSDEILEILEEIDSLQIESKGQEEKLKLIEADKVKTEATISQKLAGLNVDLERVEEATAVDIPKMPEPVVTRYSVPVCRCRKCGKGCAAKPPAWLRIRPALLRIGSVRR